ncbi:hypothetical protein [Pantoea agglomerans]|uniref:hypothetical protein n=1 Tax=Enterobacter agglomerans TaxID=549 RepID=UPI003159A985
MVNKVQSQYKKGAPSDVLRDDEERIIVGGPLYPDLLNKIDSCSVRPVTLRTDDFMAIHRVDLNDLRTYAKLALETGRYVNSQWCNGNAPKGIFACDSYTVSASVYSPKDREMIMCVVYVKLCLTDTGNTVAVISLHESTKPKEKS